MNSRSTTRLLGWFGVDIAHAAVFAHPRRSGEKGITDNAVGMQISGRSFWTAKNFAASTASAAAHRDDHFAGYLR